jgi:hypothetical protein
MRLFSRRPPPLQLSPDFYKELGDALIENMAAQSKCDAMGPVFGRLRAIDLLESVQQSARTLISAFRLSPVQSSRLSKVILDLYEHVVWCGDLITSLQIDQPDDLTHNKVVNAQAIAFAYMRHGLDEIAQTTRNKVPAITDQALKDRAAEVLARIAG